MLKSHVFVIACSNNLDKNSIEEIAAAISNCNATDVQVAPNGVIEATVPHELVSDIALMEGVCCVRTAMSYCC